MSASQPAADVIVLGGGPAGCVAAAGLARLGWRVVLIARERPFVAFEGLSARTLEGLRAAGFERALATVGAEVRREAAWAGSPASEANSEFLVVRDRLDRALGEDAEGAGVDRVTARASAVGEDKSGWRVAVSADGGDFAVGARFLVEARGREAPFGRSRRRQGPATTAVARLWSLPPGQAARTAVAAFAEGWAWLAAPGDGRVLLQFFVSGARGRLPPRKDLAGFYARLVDGLAEAPSWLGGARPAGPVTARAAESRLVEPVIEGAVARVGDAALAPDPLSGHGVFEAIGGAFAAVPVVNTILARPHQAALARRFYEDRLHDAFLRHARIGRDFYRLETRWPEATFWGERRVWPDDAPAHAAPSAGPPALERRPVVEDGFIVARDVIVTPDHPRGIWQVSGVALVPVLRLAESLAPAEAADIVARAAHELGRRPDDVAAALAWLRHRGLLI